MSGKEDIGNEHMININGQYFKVVNEISIDKVCGINDEICAKDHSEPDRQFIFVKIDIKSTDCHNKADEKSYGFKD